MKARIKRSGRVIDVFAASDSDYLICYKESQSGISYSWDELDFTDVADWEKRRYEISKDVLSALISNPNDRFKEDITKNGYSMIECAIMFADELIKQLKKKENENSSNK